MLISDLKRTTITQQLSLKFCPCLTWWPGDSCHPRFRRKPREVQHTRKRTRGATQNTHVLFRGHMFTRATLQEARSAPDPSRPGFQCRPLNLQAHDVGQFIAAVDEFPRVRQDTAALLRVTGLHGLHARPANAPGPQQSGGLLSHPPHARRRLRTSCRQSAYCSLSSQWTSSQRRRHVHRFITRRTEADLHRGP